MAEAEAGRAWPAGPGAPVRPPVYALLSFAEWVCINHSASITSWWRSRRHNAALKGAGSVPDSRHLWGEAVDLVYDGVPPGLPELQAAADHFGRLTIVREHDHDHIQAYTPQSERTDPDPAKAV